MCYFLLLLTTSSSLSVLHFTSESTPIGRLIQRFSKDLDQVDQQLPGSVGQLIASSLQIASSMAAISIVTPSFGFVVAGIFSIYFAITNFYRGVARDLKRLDSVSRSPIFSHFSETLSGLSIIRSFKRQNMLRKGNEVKLDDNLSAYFSLKAIDRWLCLRLEVLGNTIVLFSALLAVWSGSKTSSTGFSLTNALGITSLFNWAVRNAAETEALMTSVERLHFVISETPQEKSLHGSMAETAANDSLGAVATDRGINLSQHGSLNASTPITTSQHDIIKSDQELVSSGWPWRGGIVFANAYMRYREDYETFALRGVNVEINPGERIGIVGRTASGKSSLFRSILRLTELDSGSVLIDGVDMQSVSLNALRSSISVIPQGSLRSFI